MWTRFWLKRSGLSSRGKIAAFLATLFAPKYKDRCLLADRNSNGFIAPSTMIAMNHNNLILGKNVFVGDRCVFYQTDDKDEKGNVELSDKVHLYSDIIIEIGEGGCIFVDEETHIQPHCQLMAMVGSLRIGKRVEIAPRCAFYPYNHGIKSGESIRSQPLFTKGGITIGDDAWLGYGVTVLDGVHIGNGTVVGAGSVVTKSLPDNAIAFGVPAEVVRIR
jgi:acetyltransferase-like isoleucine patch superfamily enzyme